MSLEHKRKKIELIRVEAAKAELEFKIEELLADIERIKTQIANQDSKIAELKKDITKNEES